MINFRKGLINEVEIKPLRNITRLAKEKKKSSLFLSDAVHTSARAGAPHRRVRAAEAAEHLSSLNLGGSLDLYFLPFYVISRSWKSTCLLLQRWRPPRRSLRRFSRNSCSTTTSPVRNSSTHTTSSLWSTSQNSQPEPKPRCRDVRDYFRAGAGGEQFGGLYRGA